MNADKIKFIEQFERITISGIPIPKLHANLFDLVYLKQHRRYSFLYAIKSTLWLLSKVVFQRTNEQNIGNRKHLLVPSEPKKTRSSSMFAPVVEALNEDEVELMPLRNLYRGITGKVFLKWLFNLPINYYNAYRAYRKASRLEDTLKKYKIQFLVDSVVNVLLITHFRKRIEGYQTLLVDWDRHKFASLLVVAGNLNQLRTYTFVHGAINTPSKFVPLLANYCFTWSSSQCKYFESLGVNPKKLLITGNPRFDERLPNVDPLKKKIGLNNSHVILYASQNFPDFNTQVLIELILSVIESRPTWKLVVKPHPAEKLGAIKKYKKKFRNAIFLDESITVEESLALGDFVILVSSTFAIDSLIKKKDILLFNPWRKFKGIAANLKEYGAVHFNNSKELNVIIDRIEAGERDVLNTEGTQIFLDDYCTFTGEESAKRIAKALSSPGLSW